MIRFLYHLSDIHVRLFNRHDEYRVVFDNLYQALWTHKQDHDAVIVITGDILHNKIDLTPECCTLVYEWIKTMGEIAPVFFIAGNHDAQLNNRQRLDSLTAIFHDRLPPNACYLRDTGVYAFDNLLFLVNSLLDDHEWIYPEDVEKTSEHQKIICLFHGQVGRWCNNSGFYSDSCERLPSDFKGADLVLLGDIHKHQYINNCRHIAYAGSLISQNFSETDDDHGVMIWDCVSMTSYLHRIDNPYAFKEFRMSVHGIDYGGECIPVDDILLPEKGYVRVFLDDDCREAMIALQRRYPQLRIQKHYTHALHASVKDKSAPPETADMELIDEYCRAHGAGEFSEELCTFFQTYQSSSEERTDWQISRLRFSHMFGYGKDNEIDFLQLERQQIVGIFGANSSGKSTLVDILLFMLFGKISRYSCGNTIPREIIHHSQDTSSGEIEITMGMDRYVITKQCKRQKSGKIRIDQRLFRLLPTGREELTDEQRKRTDRLIVAKIGTMENFLFTNFMLQQKERSFRDMTQSARKDFLYHILRLDIFDELKKKKEEAWKELKTEIGILEKRKGDLTMTQMDERQRGVEEQQTGLLTRLGALREQMEGHREREKAILRQMIPLGPRPDRETLRQSLEQETERLQTCLERYNEVSLVLLSMDHERLASPGEPALKERFSSYGAWQEERVRAKKLIERFDTLKTAWESEEETLQAQWDEYQTSLPVVSETIALCLDQEFQRVRKGFVDDSKVWEKKRDLLREQVEWASGQKRTLTEVRQVMEEYRTLQQQYDCLHSLLKNDKDIQYNPDCPQCMSNPYYVQRTARQECLEANRKRREELGESYQECCRYEEKYLDAQTASMELYKVDRHLADVGKTREWLQQQEALRKRREILSKMDKIKTRQEGSSLRHQWEEVQELVAMIPLYEEMDRYWKNNPVLYQETIAEKEDLRTQMEKSTQTMDDLKNRIAMAEAYLRDQEENRRLQAQLEDLQSLLEQQKADYRTMEGRLRDAERELYTVEEQRRELKESEERIVSLTAQRKKLDKIVKILDRDGLPLFLLSHYVETIERDINHVVSPFMNKHIHFQIEEKEIVFGASESGQISSFYGGMEAFIVDMAIKICFGRIGKMPRSEFFMIDEGISVLDQERIASLNQIFDFLLSFNHNVFVMSHLPTVKDFVHHRIEIVKEDGYSHLVVS